MHETLAKGKHQARVRLADLLAAEHFYGVGAIEGLRGEITILDSAAFATAAASEDGLDSLDASTQAATLLVGQSVPRWTDIALQDAVTPEGFDDVIRDSAVGRGLDPVQPFMFLVEGDLIDVRLHVIDGACPVHARMQKLETPPDRHPYELNATRLRGTVVGVYAPDAVGKLTHPDTSTHAHLIFTDPKTGKRVTGHLERAGISGGATVKVPSANNPDAAPGGSHGD
jgi:hypothetical protein